MLSIVFSFLIGMFCNPNAGYCSFATLEPTYYINSDFDIDDIVYDGVQLRFAPGTYTVLGYGKYEFLPTPQGEPKGANPSKSCRVAKNNKKLSRIVPFIVSVETNCWMRFSNVRPKWDLTIRKIQ